MKPVIDEIDLHGMTVDEAIPLVDSFLYQSYKAHIHRVWIIHGRGTGALRQAVRYHLTHHSLVRQCATANGDRGGIGTTQVELAD